MRGVTPLQFSGFENAIWIGERERLSLPITQVDGQTRVCGECRHAVTHTDWR